MKYRGRKSIAKDRRLEKSNAWLVESGSQEDDEETVWQEYLHSIRDRLDIETLLYNDYMRSLDEKRSECSGADPGFFLGGVHSSLALLQHQ